MKLAFAVISILVLSACTTVEFVRKDQTPERKALLRYAPQSKPQNEAKHREKLNQQAREYCGGEFRVTKEYQAREESGSSSGVGTGFGFGSGVGIMVGTSARNTEMYQFVEVTCGGAPANTATPTPAPKR